MVLEVVPESEPVICGDDISAELFKLGEETVVQWLLHLAISMLDLEKVHMYQRTG